MSLLGVTERQLDGKGEERGGALTMFMVTGANGLVGSAVIRCLLQQGKNFVAVGRGPQRNGELGRFAYESLELTNLEAAVAAARRHRPSVVIHAAAMTAVDQCETDRLQAYQSNVAVTAALADWARAEGSRFVYVSTDYVFSGAEAPYSEHSGIGPLSVYARTKAAGELAALSLHPRAVVARTAIPFGDFAHTKKDFVRWVSGELAAKKPIRIVTDQISCPTWVEDLAENLLSLSASEFAGPVHVSGSESLSRYDFARLIARVRGHDPHLVEPIETAALKQAATRPRDATLNVTLGRSLRLRYTELEAALRRSAARA